VARLAGDAGGDLALVHYQLDGVVALDAARPRPSCSARPSFGQHGHGLGAAVHRVERLEMHAELPGLDLLQVALGAGGGPRRPWRRPARRRRTAGARRARRPGRRIWSSDWGLIDGAAGAEGKVGRVVRDRGSLRCKHHAAKGQRKLKSPRIRLSGGEEMRDVIPRRPVPAPTRRSGNSADPTSIGHLWTYLGAALVLAGHRPARAEPARRPAAGAGRRRSGSRWRSRS
jgi:hypothetical protein